VTGLYSDYWSRNLKGRYRLEDRIVDGKVSLHERRLEVVNWIHLVQGMNQLRPLVIMVMSFLPDKQSSTSNCDC
jgi:hypothetical protein